MRETPPSTLESERTEQRRVLSFADGWKRRARALRRRRAGKVVWLIGAAVLVLVLAWLALWSPLLAVTEVQVSGTSAAVRSLGKSVGGQEVGRSLLRVDTAGVEGRLEEDSRVADATVRRGFPRSLVIEVVARVPVLGLQKSQGKVELVDVSGVTIETVSEAPAGVPVVQGATGVASGDGVHATVQVMAALPESLRTRVRDLHIDDSGSVSFVISATRIVWGPAEESELKARLVQILMSKKPKTIDVSAPETPVTT